MMAPYMGRADCQGKQKLVETDGPEARGSRERDQIPTRHDLSQQSLTDDTAAPTSGAENLGNAMRDTTGRIVLGFIAAALSVLIVHQGIVYILGQLGMTRTAPWSLRPLGYGPVSGIPVLLNNVFWGGLWGILFAFVYERLPSGMSWLKGLIFGCIIVLISNWTMLPLIRQYVFSYPPQALFSGFVPMAMLNVLLIVGGFGLGLGIIYRLIARDRAV